jgi:hypothetical protein
MVAQLMFMARRVQPAAFALTLACLSIGLTWTTADRLDGPWEQIMGGLALGTALVLIVGWCCNSWRLMRWGMATATMVWIYVAWVTLMVNFQSWTSTLLACSWAALAAGSYWLEERDYAAVKLRQVTEA